MICKILFDTDFTKKMLNIQSFSVFLEYFTLVFLLQQCIETCYIDAIVKKYQCIPRQTRYPHSHEICQYRSKLTPF